ncbi:Na+/H+ antiporter subunit G [Idiomarina tyrosinivorans]|uniref:Na+/H+ antiporter subunit G n=2 Tax=Idiomarina tyrosinivorans TaxID=1445662 RepID=A0A432ZF64_9GAMM|nr:Na+/H+ antiporter subunit G [Idiomarina tyrosinivorans]
MEALHNMPQWAQWTVSFFLILGAVFAFIGSLGLAILPDFLTRLHAPTKNTTMGVGGVVIASIFFTIGQGVWHFHELLIAAFLFLTAPISAHLLAKAALHLDLKRISSTKDLRSLSQTQQKTDN